ncbi:hypothetical protein GCM10010464_49190 [Pseudonocardia yunnanensis]|jgi:hypothetical protein|uniref:Uncharacterized protein n=1 Tax=Pseudonocardia yunnanensis TaxID=58107 RepID=A0ABW4F3V6_9PSEU
MRSTDGVNGTSTGGAGAPPEPVNPWFVVDVERLDRATVARVVRQVAASEGLDQLAYRETEIDALWSLADMAARAGLPGAEVALSLLWTAHDAVGVGDVDVAVEALSKLQDLGGLEDLNDAGRAAL